MKNVILNRENTIFRINTKIIPLQERSQKKYLAKATFKLSCKSK